MDWQRIRHSRRNVKYTLTLLTAVQVKHAGPDRESFALSLKPSLRRDMLYFIYGAFARCLERHILKNNKHSSVPFWWRRGPWVYGTGLSANPPFCLSAPPPARTFTRGLFFRPLLAGTRPGEPGTRPGGWKSASPWPAQRHGAPRLSESGCECILTPPTSRSGLVSRASRAYVQERKEFRCKFNRSLPKLETEATGQEQKPRRLLALSP